DGEPLLRPRPEEGDAVANDPARRGRQIEAEGILCRLDGGLGRALASDDGGEREAGDLAQAHAGLALGLAVAAGGPPPPPPGGGAPPRARRRWGRQAWSQALRRSPLGS